MTTPFHHEPGVSPPPQCPAHNLGTGPGGLRRLYGPEAENDPAGLYDKLRAEHGTVAPVLLHGDVPAWLVLGHSENLHLTRTPSQFSRDSRRWRALQDGSVAPDHPLAPIFTWQPVCVFADGAKHERQRGAVTDSMERIDTRGVRRHINRFSNRLVNDFSEKGSADLVSQFAEHLPMMVMCAIFGMPEEYDERLVQAARDMTRGTETAVASNAHIVSVLTRLVERRRAEPAPDFASWLVEHPATMSDIEVVEHLRLILIAAYESTANLIANVLRMVLTDPRFRARLSGGHMTVPEAVEQTLWDEPPFTAVFGRWAVGDTEPRRPADQGGRRPARRHRPGQHRPRGAPGPHRQHGGQPRPPRVQRWPARVPRPGHRPSDRRRGCRRPADAAAGPGGSAPRKASCAGWATSCPATWSSCR